MARIILIDSFTSIWSCVERNKKQICPKWCFLYPWIQVGIQSVTHLLGRQTSKREIKPCTCGTAWVCFQPTCTAPYCPCPVSIRSLCTSFECNRPSLSWDLYLSKAFQAGPGRAVLLECRIWWRSTYLVTFQTETESQWIMMNYNIWKYETTH